VIFLIRLHSRTFTHGPSQHPFWPIGPITIAQPRQEWGGDVEGKDNILTEGGNWGSVTGARKGGLGVLILPPGENPLCFFFPPKGCLGAQRGKTGWQPGGETPSPPGGVSGNFFLE